MIESQQLENPDYRRPGLPGAFFGRRLAPIRPPSPAVASWPYKLANALLIALFLGIICAPFADKLIGLDPAPAQNENRTLAVLPRLELNSKSLTSFPSQFEAYFNDHFGFRRTLIRWNSLFKLFVLKISPSPTVLVGRKGWFFGAESQFLDVYRADAPFAPSELARWQAVLEERNQWLNDRGIRYLFVIVPESATIYPEYLPSSIKRVHPKSQLDQLVEHLQAHSKVDVLDLRNALWQAKAQDRLYHRTDTHWNDAGAFVGSQQIIGRLARQFPELKHRDSPDFSQQVKTGPGGDLARLMGLVDVVREEWIRLVPKAWRSRSVHVVEMPGGDGHLSNTMEIAGLNSPRAMMLHDSFGIALFPFVAEQFGHILFQRYPTAPLDFPTELIKEEQPQVVIQEVVERSLWPVPPNLGFAEERFAKATDVRLLIAGAGAGAMPLVHQEAVVASQGDEILLKATGAAAGIALPAFTLEPGTHPIVEIEITSPVQSLGRLFYPCADGFDEQHCLVQVEKAGRHKLYFEVADPTLLPGYFRFDFATAPGDYILHRVEVRAVKNKGPASP